MQEFWRKYILPRRLFSEAALQRLRSPLSTLVVTLIGIFTLLAIYLGIAGFVEGLHTWATPDFAQNSHWLALGQLLSISALLLLSLNFVLATRWYWVEKLAGGLDKVYKLHEMTGRLAILLLIFHPTLLVASAIPNGLLVQSYIVPGQYLPYTMGSVSLIMFLILIGITVFAKIPFERWLFLHRLLGIPFVIGGVHAFLAKPEYTSGPSWRWFIIAAWALGVFAYLYTLLLYKYLGPSTRARVTSLAVKSGINQLHLQTETPQQPRPGQFFLMELLTQRKLPFWPAERHPFSYTSLSATGNELEFGIKQDGDFTRALPTLLKAGDPLKLFGPYGTFAERINYENITRKQVWIAGGIGVTPFLSMTQALVTARNKPDALPAGADVHLVYSVKTAGEDVYGEQFASSAAHTQGFNFHPHFSDSEGFLTAEKVLALTATTPAGMKAGELEVFLCGPTPMMFALADQFRAVGLKYKYLHYEEFSFN